MKVSTLKTLEADEVIEVSDLEGLDFMVVIRGALTLEFDDATNTNSPKN